MADKIIVTAAVIRKNGKLLLTTRPEGKPPYGLEFPGGKVDKNESLSAALKRELREELNVDALILDPIYKINTDRLVLWFLRTVIPDDCTICCCEGQQYFWIDPQDPEAVKELFDKIPLLPTDQCFWDFLCEK